jgi:hypothetical protein
MKKAAFILVCALLVGCSGNVKRTSGDLSKQEGGLKVVERTLLEKVMSDLKLRSSAGADDDAIKSLGRGLGVNAVVVGTLTRRFICTGAPRPAGYYND